MTSIILICPCTYASDTLINAQRPLSIVAPNYTNASDFSTPNVKRLVVPLFVGGQTAWKSGSKLFAPMNNIDVNKVNVLVKEARSKNRQVWGMVDLLKWTGENVETAQDVLAAHPGFEETEADCGCYGTPKGKFASPFEPQVRSELKNLATEIAASFPELDGIVVRARLSPDAVLGYSDAARAAYIEAKNIDPIDIVLGAPVGSAEEKVAREWIDWRMAQMSSLVGEFSQTLKAKNPKLQVAALADSAWARRSPGQRNTTLEDALQWARNGAIDEIVLEGRWARVKEKQSWTTFSELVRQMPKPVKLSAALVLHEKGEVGNEPINPLGDAMALQGENGDILLLADSFDDWTRAREFATKTWPTIAWAMQ
jgi:hypothetical protein